MDAKRKKDLLSFLVEELLSERGQTPADAGLNARSGIDALMKAFRALVNTRPAWPAHDHFLNAQDELLQGLIEEAGIRTPDDAESSPLDDRIALWRGDITVMAADAIVNAANSALLGCWVPGHFCIDNAIHTFAGVQLRAACARIMEEQGHEEPTGRAKVTPAFNLPSRYVIHTVGPIANSNPTDLHRRQLESSYRSCLDAAAAIEVRSLAFCCISTGVFGFPQSEAAPLAVRTVRTWLDEAAETGAAGATAMQVVFNVFSESDEEIYRELLALS